MFFYPAVSMVSVGPEGHHGHPSIQAGLLASSRFSLVLGLVVADRFEGGRKLTRSCAPSSGANESVDNALTDVWRFHGDKPLKLGF